MIRMISGIILLLFSVSGLLGYIVSSTSSSRTAFALPLYMVLFYIGPLAAIGAMLF